MLGVMFTIGCILGTTRIHPLSYLGVKIILTLRYPLHCIVELILLTQLIVHIHIFCL